MDFKKYAQSIHRLDTHPIQTDRLLEGLTIILRPSINLGGTVHQLTQRNPATVVTHLHPALVIDVDANLLTVPHDKLIHRIIECFLQENIDPIVRRRPITQLTNIHSGTEANVLSPVQTLNIVLGVTSGHDFLKSS